MKWLAVFSLILCSNPVHADGKNFSVPSHPMWKEECSSCHIAYPPQLLTADNWGKLMKGLDKHFGVNASMDAKDAKSILDFLQRNAGKGVRYSASSLKVSDTAWFKREHSDISKRTWSNPLVKSRSNCTACHVKAEQGDWSERGVRIPGAQLRNDD